MTETLSRLLAWTGRRIGQKAAMQRRFSWLLEHYRHEISFPIIKVAGTNGKGSVSAMLSAFLCASEKKVGLFTSPHLVSPTERFRIDDRDISEEALEAAAMEIEAEVHQLTAQRGEAFTPSFFEVLILIAIRLFKHAKVDIAIFEAGIGGANDAVSLLPDFMALITSIGKDHQQQLGHSLGEIARDKAGIIRSGQLLVNHLIDPVLKKIIRHSAELEEVFYLESIPSVQPAGPVMLAIPLPDRVYKIKPALEGHFQQQNIDLVVSAGRLLWEKNIIASWEGLYGLEKARWPGRYEKFGAAPQWLIDAAHNEPGLRALIESLNKEYKQEERILVYGNSEEKDFTRLTKLIPEIATEVYLVDDFYKAVPIRTLELLIDKEVTVRWEKGLAQTLSLIQTRYPDRVVVVTGSIFMIGQARKWILAHGLDNKTA